MATNLEKDKWTETIERLFAAGRITSHQCAVYNKNSSVTNSGEKCGCQRSARHHSFDGAFFGIRPKPEDWNVKEHTKKLRQLIHHSTASRKFLRCACENKDDVATLYELMTSVCGQPKLIISVYGGRKHFTMSEDIEREFMDSLAEAAVTSGTWIITSGLNNGAARLIGEGIDRLRALTDTKQPATLLGISWWGNVTEKTRELVVGLQREGSKLNNDQMNINTSFLFDDKDERSLEKNHTHFLLLDDGKYQSSYYENETNEQSRALFKQRSISYEPSQDHQRENVNNSYKPGSSPTERQSGFATTTKYPKEMQRVDFVSCACETDKSYAVTIIVEGGINTCVAVLNDIEMKRPVIFIQGSGKIADVIAGLLDLTAKNEYTPARLPEQNEIEHNLRRFPMRTRTEKEHRKLIEQIREIMHPDRRRYLTVFRINSELNLKQTIYHAIFRAHFAQTDLYKANHKNDALESQNENSQKENLLELAIKWDCFDQATDLLADLQYNDKPELLAKLFKQALLENRPAFVDYFLRINYDPRCTLNFIKDESSLHLSENQSTIVLNSDSSFGVHSLTPRAFVIEYQNQMKLSRRGLKFIFDLYKNAANVNTRNSARKRNFYLFQPQTENQLTEHYRRWIGDFMWPVSTDPYQLNPHNNVHTRISCSCKWICSCRDRNTVDDPDGNLKQTLLSMPTIPLISGRLYEMICDGSLTKRLMQTMLRDLLYWSIFTDRIDMAKVILLHLRSRICPALSCAAILRNHANVATISDQRDFYRQQAKDFETYATNCINACYSTNERKACELLIREHLLFGKITCMQVAISSSSKSFINTDCFSQVLNRIWYKRLSSTDKSFFWNLKFTISFFTLGLLAPFVMLYCPADDATNDVHQQNYGNGEKLPKTSSINGERSLSSQLSNTGINYYTEYRESSSITWRIYVNKFKDFHQCPMVKMCYHFIGYIWLLLAFSYMILFKLTPPEQNKHTFHWTELYTIVTIFTIFFEHIRKSSFYHLTYMRESQQKSWIIRIMLSFLRGAPYNLFAVGMTLWYTYGNIPSVFTAARIILAIDLELWYLWSLKFITVIKILSPKVFMMRNMLRDLFGFLYVAIICVAAYGVASRAMIKQGEVAFTPQSIFENIFYAPYWFLYEDADDEKKTLDSIIGNSTTNLRTEAIATHVLLAFHMLFFNILLLNLLIAVFATTISKVENNAKYFYYSQRYIITQEYFEKPIMPVPPLILVWYLFEILRYIWHRLTRCCRKGVNTDPDEYHVTRVFKMIPIDPQFIEKCTAFEHAATYAYARRVVENKKEKTRHEL